MFAVTAKADVKLPGIFGNGMVLQQGMPLKVWGVASPGESASVSFAADKDQTLVPYQIRGVIWYQGEAKHGDGMRYVEKTRELLAGWRNGWGKPELPCYIVQIAPFKYPGESPFVEPEFWEAQLAITNSIPNTGIASTIDLGDPIDMPPKRKKEVGARLALQALQKTYGRSDVVADGPSFKSLFVEGAKMRVSFDHVPAGLISSDGKKLNSFEILDADKGEFVEADAEIDGKTVILSASQVAKPIAGRFAWSNVASPNLVSSDGLPAYPFRAAEPNAWRIFRALSGVSAPVR